MYKLKKFITQIRGVSYKPSNVHENLSENSIALLRANNIQSGNIDLSDLVYIDKEIVKDIQLLKAGDILICSSSGSKNLVGKAAYIEKDLPITFGAFCKVIRPNNIYPKYLGHFFDSPYYRRYISSASMGANINNIRANDIDDINISIPSYEDQRSISTLFDKVNSLISLRYKQLSYTDTLIKSRFIEMFGEPDINNLKWEKDILSNHLKVIGGYAFKSDSFSSNGIPILRIGNINTGKFRNTNLVYWNDSDSLNRYKVFPGDLVMSLTGTVGKNDYGNVCIIGNDYDVYYLNQRNAKLEITGELNNYYLSELLKFPRIKKRLTGINRGIRQANISNKDILNMSIPIPPIKLQNKFADFIKQVDKSKAEIQNSLAKLETLKKSLMQEYFA